MTNELILIFSAGAVGFLMGAAALLLLRERPGARRFWETGGEAYAVEDLGQTDKQEDTHDQRGLPTSFVEATTGRTPPMHLTARSGSPVAMLTAEGGELGGRSWLLRYAASTTIGRFDDCDIAVNDHGVSRLHAQITHRTDAATAHEFAIFDYSSMNGTMVNGQPINAVASLQDGDTIHIGNTRFIFHRVRGD
ncbi:MAG: FHA domain-containing protein [Ardenticatenales bacterium]|nr:FHA domain-containing protein [Ardenticatenales bacterium]